LLARNTTVFSIINLAQRRNRRRSLALTKKPDSGGFFPHQDSNVFRNRQSLRFGESWPVNCKAIKLVPKKNRFFAPRVAIVVVQSLYLQAQEIAKEKLGEKRLQTMVRLDGAPF